MGGLTSLLTSTYGHTEHTSWGGAVKVGPGVVQGGITVQSFLAGHLLPLGLWVSFLGQYEIPLATCEVARMWCSLPRWSAVHSSWRAT